MPVVWIAAILLLIGSEVWGQTNGDYRSRATGNWNTGNTWQVYNGGWNNCAVGDYPGVTPGAGTVTIQNGNIVTLNISPANAIGSINIPGGNQDSWITFSGAFALNVTGATLISSTSNGDWKAVLVNTGTLTTSSISLSSTNNDDRDAYIEVSTGTVNVTGSITMDNTNPRTYIRFTGAGTVNVGGTISGGGITSNGGGGATAPTSGTVNYNNNGNQNVGAYTYYNLTASNTGTKTLTGNTGINNNLSISGSAILASDIYSITGNGTGTFTMAAGTGLTLGNAGSATAVAFPSNFTSGNTTLNNTSTVTYQSNGAQTVSNVPTYGNLSIATSNTKTLAGSITINNNLSVAGSATLATAQYQITGNATGTLTMASGTGLTLGSTTNIAAITFPTNYTSGNISLDPSSTVTYQANAAQNVSNSPVYGNLTMSTGAAASAKTALGNTAIAGDLTINNNTTFSFGATAKTVTVTGNLSGTGTLGMTGAGLAHILNLGGASNTISTFTTTAGSGSTVNYNRAGNQQLFASANYRNLTVSGGGTKTMQGNVTVNNTLSLSNGNLSLGSGAFNLTLPDGANITGTFDNTHMVVCDGTGSLVVQSNATGGLQTTYPVGTGTYYTPMQISSLAAAVTVPASVSVRAVAGIAPGANVNDLNKHWIVNTSNLSGINATVSFTYDMAEVLGTQADYVPYLFTGGLWTIPAGSSASGINPFSSAGTSVLTGTWTARETPRTYYSYQSGDWATATTWTVDPSGTLSVNPAVPAAGDRVVILNGRTVSTSVSRTVYSVQINEGGFLDLGTSTGHNFGEVSGQGWLRLQTGTFPGGTFTNFIAAGGGTVEYYNTANFNLSQNTYNNLIFNLSASTIVGTVLGNLLVNGNLTIQQGDFRINSNTATTRLDLEVKGNVVVEANGLISLGTGNIGTTTADAHRFIIKGNFTNNGQATFTNLAAANYFTYPNHRVDVVFDNPTADQDVLINGYTRFYRIEINKGSDQTYVLNLDATAANQFYLFGRNDLMGVTPVPDAPNINNLNALGLMTGTLRLGSNITVPSLSEESAAGLDLNYHIDEDACLWIDGANVTQTTNANGGNSNSFVMYGKLRLTNPSSILNLNNLHGIVMRATAAIVIEDGSLTTPCVRTSTVAGTHRGSFNMAGGTMTVTGNLTGDLGHPSFSFTWPEMSFTMSGGELIVNQATSGAGNGSQFSLVIGSKAENTSITGGTVRLISANRNANFTSTAPFWNLTINSANALYSSQILAYAGSGASAAAVAAQPLVVLNDFSLINLATFIPNNQNVTVSHDFVMAATSIYTPGTNTTTFNGGAGQVFDNAGTITTGLYNLDIANSSNTSISQNLTIRNNLAVSGGCFLQDMGRTINVAGNITNSGTHISQAVGGIFLNGAGAQSIGGNGSGIFGNLIVNKATGLASLTANQSLTGNLRLANGLLDIATYNLALSSGSNVYDALAGTTAVFSGTKMIRTAGNMSDGGVTKAYNSTAAFIFPVGTASDYTPATIQFSSLPATWGDVNIKPVAQFNPFVTSTNSLNYYWKVTQSGFGGIAAGSVSHTYRYVDSDLVGRGTEANYIPGVYDPFAWVYINDISQVVDASNDIRFTNVSYLEGDYTAGELAAFQSVKVFYSRLDGPWNDVNTWSSVAVGGAVDGALPGNNNPVVIGDGITYNHTVTIPAGYDNVVIGGLQINSGSTLDITTTTGHNFGAIPDSKVTGTGRLMISSAAATATFPNGDFGNFLSTGGGTIEYYNTGTQDFTIPTVKTNYFNLVLSPANGRYIVMPDINLMVYGNYTVSGTGTGVARLNSASARTLTVDSAINITSGTLQFRNTAIQTIYANNDIQLSSGATFNVANTGTGVNNLLYVAGNLDNDGTFDMYTTAAMVCNVYFTGSEDKVLSGAGTNEFNYLNVDKGNSRNTILDVTADNITLTGAGTALVLDNGTFRVSNPLLNFILSTTSSFTIPTSAALSVNEGTVTIGTTSDAGDLILAGRLEIINNGIINIGNGGNYNNDIEYASGGTPEIIVLGGSLNVNGQIRRPITITTGSLNYTQGGTSVVTVAGRQANNARGMLEILNSGSSFNMSGGTLIISRNFNNILYNELYLAPASSSVTGGTIQLGTASAAAGSAYNFVSSIPLWNLVIDATTTTKSANVRVHPLVILNDLTINGNSDFRANGLNVSLGRDLINNNSNAGTGISTGGYQAGSLTQVTTFNGTGSQSITGAGANLTNFANLVVSTASSITLSSNTNVRVNANLTLNTGTLNDGSNEITVVGNIDNSAIHASSTSSGGIILAGSQKQTISGSGTGVFGNVVLNNSLGVDLVDNSVINGQLTFTDGSLYIDDYLLTLGASATIGGTPDASHFIILNGVISDQGVKKLFPAGTADFTFPIGVAGKYTPVRYNITANGAPGTILIRPINYKHPSTYENPAATNELQYYWNVVSSGFSGLTLDHEYNYIGTDALPDETNYVVGKFTVPTYSWSVPPSGSVNSGSDNFTLTNVNYIDGEYTCGVNIPPSPNFQDMPIYYSRNSTSGGNWTDPNAWTLNADGTGGPAPSYPQGNTAIIFSGHTITIDANSQNAYAVEINGTLAVGTTLYHSLGHIRGGGTLHLTGTGSGSFILPAGEYEDFMGNSSSTIEFYNNSGTPATLPLKPGNDYKPFQNVIFSGNGVKYVSAENMRVLGNLTIETGSGTLSNVLHNKNITILGNWTDNNTAASGGFVPGLGTVAFNGTSPQTLTISGASTTEQFYNLRINNAAGMTISGNGKSSVSKYLYLTLGNITTNSTNLLSITNTSASAVVGGGSTSFVNGPLQKRILSGSYFNFPVGNGNGTRYGNLYVSTIAVTGNYIAQYYNHNPGSDGYDPNQKVNPIDVVSNVEYWRINGPAGATSNVQIRWDDQSAIIPASASSRTKLRIVEWNGSAWQNRGNVISDGGQTSGTIQTNPVVSINGDHRFTIGVESLPTVAITSSNSSFCNDGTSTTSITVALTGTAPWTIKYKVNGTNETTINNIGSSPYNIVIGSSSPGISGNGDYTYNMSYVSDVTGATGIRDFTSTVVITANEAPAPSISGLATLPLNQNTNYQTGTGNISGHTYSWTISGNGTINSGGNTYLANVMFTSGASGWVSVTETVTATGCAVTTSNFIITLTDVPSPVVTGPASICINTTQTYSTPDVPGHSYLWTLPSGGGSIVGVNNTATVQVNWTNSGPYTVSVTETGSSSESDTLDVTVNPLPSINLVVSDPSICEGQTANVIVTAGEAGADYTLRRNSDNFVITTVHNGNAGDVTLPVTPASPGTYVYNVLAISEYSCQAQLTDLSTVVVNAVPLVTITGAVLICEETATTLDAGAGFSSYAWSFGAINLGTSQTQAVTTQSLPPLIRNATETYTVVVTNAAGCSGSDTHTIDVYRLPETGPNYYVPNENNL